MASIKKRPDGKWRARYRDHDGKEHARHFPRKVDAQQWLDGVTADVLTGRYVSPAAGKSTLQGYFADYKNRQLWEDTTAKNYDLAMRDCTFADVPFAKLRPTHVEHWIRDMSSRLAPTSVRTRFGNVRTVVRAAKRDNYIATDPTEGVKLPSVRAHKDELLVPTADELRRIFDASEQHHRAFWALCAFAGLRLGEAAAMQADDLRFLQREVRVQRQVQRGKGGDVQLRPPKHGATRTVAAADELLQLLGEHVEQGVFGDEGWLFLGQNGNPPHQNTVGRWWRSTIKRAGVRHFRLHDLRHHFASGLIAAGCDVVTVQRALGHQSATVTLDTYSHLWPSGEDRTRRAASGLVQSVFKNPADSRRTEDAQ